MVCPLFLVSGMDVDKMDESDWNYHGEGNRSLVVAHVQHSRVLRLLKYSAEDSENAPQTPEQAYRQLQSMVDFCKNVMAPLLGDKFIHSGEVVKLPLEFVRQLSIKIQHQRPAWRCDKVMDIYSGCALLLPNLTSPSPTHSTHTPPLCIEIKPKCGFLPTSRQISKDIKTRVCRYCLHQHYKVANGKWKRRSLYCPLDLFSGNRQRMHFAIKHLIEEPQNNLKIFKGGQCIYGDQASGDLQDVSWLLQQLRPYFLYGSSRTSSHLGNKAILNDFIQVLLNALLSGGVGEQEEEEEREEGRSVCDASLVSRELVRHGSHVLPRDSVLSRILQVQMLDTLDIEGLFPLYRRLDQYLQDYTKDRTSLQVDGPYNEVFLEKVQKCAAEDDGSVEYAAAKVHQYRVAMTAKDCSIMVCLVPRSDEEEDEGLRRQRDQSRGSGFWSWVSVLDLDPKPVSSVPRQHRLDHKIVSYYLRTAAALPKGTLPRQRDRDRDRDECTLVFHPV